MVSFTSGCNCKKKTKNQRSSNNAMTHRTGTYSTSPSLHCLLIHYFSILLLTSLLSSSSGLHTNRTFPDQHIIQITPSPLACQICIIRRRNQTNSFRRPSVKITEIMSSFLDLVSPKCVLVIDNSIMCCFY